MSGWTDAWNKAGQIWTYIWTVQPHEPYVPTSPGSTTIVADTDNKGNDGGDVSVDDDDYNDGDPPDPDDNDSVSQVVFHDPNGDVVHSIAGLGITFSALSGATNDNSFTRYTSWVSLLNGDGNVVGSGGDDFDLEVGSGGTATIDGNAGNDRVYVWHQKNIVYDGGAGIDTVSFNTATGDTYPIAYTQRLVIDLLTDTGQKNPYGGTLSLTNVENIVGTDNQTLADDITGDNNANVIGDGVYDTGHDTIHALGGNDRVELAEGAFGDNGGIHADGGDGVDTLAVNMGSWSSSGSNKLDLTNQANNTGVFHSDVLTNFEVFAHGSGFYGPSGQTFIFIDTNDGHVVETIGQTSNLTLNGGNDVAILRWVTGSHSVHADGGAGMDTLSFEVDFFASSNILDLLHPANDSGTFTNSTFTGFERFVHVEADGLNTATQRFTFRGNANAQTVLGALGIDDIRTAGGNDVLNGGLGKDVLGGGAGRDTFIFNSTLGPANIDRILDFSVPSDTIKLENAIFAGIGGNGHLAAIRFHVGPHAHDANDRIIYNANTGALLYDSNGNAGGHEIAFATLAKHLAVTAADFIVI